jgi:UDP:flavonoid glycosyltransferase YjiC (YdhE family)
VSEAFTRTYDDALHALAPAAPRVDDAFAAHGDLVLFNHPAELHPPERTARLPAHVFLGSSVRFESPDEETRRWLARTDDRPLVVVSFGTFLSARTDVLAKVVGALRRLDVRVALAIGAADREVLGELPPAWLVRPHVSQVTLLGHADLLVTHGGNKSVTEALKFGVPMMVMPFSTDLFDGAAAVERALAGVALDPNRAPRSLIAGSIRGLLRNPPDAPAAIGTRLRREPGPEVAYAAMVGIEVMPDRRSSTSTSESVEAQVP